VTADELLAAARALVDAGVHNLNFVTPDHFWPHVRDLCRRLRAEGVTLPFIANCSGYQAAERIPDMAAAFDIFLPDFKFADARLAATCMAAPDYPATALAALWKMVEAKGFLTPWDASGAGPAKQGVLVRHLVLPGHVENSLAALRLLRTEFGRMLPLSVMSQFRPTPACAQRGLLDRSLQEEEYRRVCDLVLALDFQSVYIQPSLHDTGFLPDFTREQPFAGNRPVRKVR
jgi:putative pyruvate formate lyase activating enzyme